jgi:hypothetical protein
MDKHPKVTLTENPTNLNNLILSPVVSLLLGEWAHGTAAHLMRIVDRQGVVPVRSTRDGFPFLVERWSMEDFLIFVVGLPWTGKCVSAQSNSTE